MLVQKEPIKIRKKTHKQLDILNRTTYDIFICERLWERGVCNTPYQRGSPKAERTSKGRIAEGSFWTGVLKSDLVGTHALSALSDKILLGINEAVLLWKKVVPRL